MYIHCMPRLTNWHSPDAESFGSKTQLQHPQPSMTNNCWSSRAPTNQSEQSKVTQNASHLPLKAMAQLLSCLATDASRTSHTERPDHARIPSPAPHCTGQVVDQKEDRTRQHHHTIALSNLENPVSPQVAPTSASPSSDPSCRHWNLRRIHSCTWVLVSVPTATRHPRRGQGMPCPLTPR